MLKYNELIDRRQFFYNGKNLLLQYLTPSKKYNIELNMLKIITNSLVDNNINIDDSNDFNHTSLHLLCSHKNITFDMLVFLIDKYIETNSSLFSLSTSGEHAFTLLCCNNNITEEMINYFISKYCLYNRSLQSGIIMDIKDRNVKYLKLIAPFFKCYEFSESDVDEDIISEFENLNLFLLY